MKTLIPKLISTVIIFYSLSFFSCTESNDEQTTDTPFEPIEITFTEDFFSDCDQTVSIENVDLTFRAISKNEPSANTIGDCDFRDNSISIEQRENHPFNGFYRLFLSSHLEIDISKLSGYSEIRLGIDDNCAVGCTGANLYVNDAIVSTVLNQTSNPGEELVFNIKNLNVQKITVYSFEGALYKINID